MKQYQFIFSPTGGTEKAAKAITQNWPQVETVDLSDPSANYSDISCEPDSLVLIAMPSFGGVAPKLALDRLAGIKGNGAKCVIAVVYGNRAYDDTLVQMEDYAENAGFQVIAAVSAVAEHSIIRKYAAGRPDSEDCKELSKFGDQILEKTASVECSKPHIPGNRPYKESGAGIVPKADAACTSCGLCAQKCPAGAISGDNLRVSEKNKCISCMRCVSVCPSHARKISSLMTSVVAAALKKACAVEKANELFI